MLCDMFAEMRGMKEFRSLPAYIRTSVEVLGDKVASAPRFILDRSATQMIQSLSLVSPRAMVQALPVCRLPHRTMWVEFAFKDRLDWLVEARKQGIQVQSNDLAAPPSRLGFLLEQKDDDASDILVHPAWSHIAPAVDVCKLSMRVITGEAQQASEETINSFRRRYLADKDLARGHGITTEADLVAFADLSNRVHHIVPPWMEGFWASLVMHPEAFREAEELARYDLAAEWRFVLSLLTILNSRNVISYSEEATFEKLNKQRKKKGKPPVLSHREIRLNLSKVQRQRLGEYAQRSPSARPTEAHLVRGHWKLRKTGLYWWSPHVRYGDQTSSPPVYKVTA
jgi:hypothetical protein